MAEADARQLVADAFRQFGLADLANWVMDNVIEGTDVTTVYLKLRETPAYKRRFPAMEALQKKVQAGGRGYTEGDYIEIENAYRTTLSQSGLPPDMWDSPDDFARLISAEVAPVEVQRRVDAAKDAVLSTDPSTRVQMQRLYGITVNDLMAFALDPARGSDHLRRMANTAILAGMGADAGLGTGLGAAQWERYAGAGIQDATGFGEARGLIAEAGALATRQRRLASIEGESFTDVDALDVTVLRDTRKGLRSEQRARREKARFSGSSGVSSGTLRGAGI